MAFPVIRYRDQVINIPAVDIPDLVSPVRRVDNRVAFSTAGKNESAIVGAFDNVDVRTEEVTGPITADELEAFWSHARRGKPFTFSFDSADANSTAIEDDVGPGVVAGIKLSELQGIVVGSRLMLIQDILGRNTSLNQLPSAQSICDLVADYALGGTALGSLVTPAKEGTDAIKLDTLAVNDSMSFASSIVIPRESFVTFSIWYRDQSSTLAYRMKMVGGSTTIIGAAIVSTAIGIFRRASVTGFFPGGASSLTVSIEDLLGTTESIVVDAWQVEFKQHATPWVNGSVVDDQKTQSIDIHSEIITVQSISPTLEQTIVPTAALKFGYKKRDAVRSLLHWERGVIPGRDTPLRQKSLNHRLRLRFREVP